MATAEPPRRRSQRGARRRQILVDAAAALVAERGIAAVTHRAVAERAELPLAATTYYFASLAELVEAGVGVVAEGWLRRAQAAVAGLPPVLRGPAEVARAVMRVVSAAPAGARPADAGDLLVLYDRYLEAGRHPSLQPAVRAHNERLDGLLREVLERGGLAPDPGTARGLLAIVDGAILRALAEGGDPTPPTLAVVEAFVRRLPVTSPA